MEKKQEWLKETDSGVIVTLTKALDVDGAKVKALTMREPTVGDQEASAKSKGDDASREITLFANLCDVTPDQVRSLTLRDYKRLQAAFLGFID